MMNKNEFLESLIGTPYKIGATGPDAFDCYGLARHVQIHLAGRKMPLLEIAPLKTRQQTELLLKHPERLLWGEVLESQAREFDLVLMGNVAGRDFHLGTVIVPSTAKQVLHISQYAGVVVDDIPTLKATGFNYLRFFRRK